MDFKKERILCHNEFPKRVWFKAEKKFKERLERNNEATPFVPLELEINDNTDFQTCVGHLIDGLEALPFRPDYMFDHCFKIIDETGQFIAPNGGIKGIVQKAGNELLNNSRAEWIRIIDLIGSYLPLMTCRFLTKRICEEHFKNGNNSDQFTRRVKDCFGSNFYNEYINRFALDKNGNLTGTVCNDRIEKGASFLRLYMSGKKGTQKKKGSSYNCLDLTKEENVPTPNKRIEFILSILLFTMRNERSHGTVISPFRTSKSTIDRYNSYYFSMLCSYIFCMGIMSLNRFGGITGQKILECCEKNIDLQKTFFNS